MHKVETNNQKTLALGETNKADFIPLPSYTKVYSTQSKLTEKQAFPTDVRWTEPQAHVSQLLTRTENTVFQADTGKNKTTEQGPNMRGSP